MKKLKQNQKSNTSIVEPEENEVLNTREKYHKEIAKTKRNILERSVKSEVKQDQDKQEQLAKVVDLQDTSVAKSDDESKFHELRKYLLSDTSDKESSPTIKEKSPSKKKQTRNKEKMLEIRSEAEKSPVKNFRSTRGSSVEKKDKGPLSPTKKQSPNVKIELNNKDSPIIGNKTLLSAGKKVKHTPSPEKLSVITPESPRTGSRQRSPNLRYADDMVMFPLKSPKRQIFKKDSNTENCNNNDVSLPKTSLSTECQTSQLYSLLTGTILNSDCTKIKTETNNSEKHVSDLPLVNQKVETNNLNGDITDRLCETADVGNKSEIEPIDTSSNTVSISKEKDIPKTIPDAVSKIKVENSGKEVGQEEALQNLSNVIDQIIVESTQEDIPGWAVYEDKPLRLPRKPRRKRKSLQEKIIDGELGYTVVTTIKKKGPDGTPTSSGDEDDSKEKRRVTKPILKRSIIRMSPALGLLVGHDEDGFTMFDEHKNSKSDNEDNGENDETEQKDGKKRMKKLNSDLKQMPTKSSSTGISVSKPISTQPQMRLIGSAGTKATIVSGSQSVPCIIVPSSSTIGGQTLLTLQGSNASNISLIPSNKISLIGTPTNKVIPSSISPVSPVGPPMVSMIPSSNVRPVQPLQVVTSVQSILKTPTTRTFFRLSQGQLISSSGQPLLSTKVLPGTKGQLISSPGSSLLSTNVLSGSTTTTHTFTTTSPVISLASQSNPLNIPPNSKVLILKKSDIPNTSGTILVNSSSPVSGRPGMSLLKKSPVTVSKPEVASITTSSQPVVTEKLSLPITVSVAAPVMSPKTPTDSESGQSSLEIIVNEKKLIPLDDLISKVKTNMDSLVQLPKIFTSAILMDYESESDSDSEMSDEQGDDMEEGQNVADETKLKKVGHEEKSEIDDSVDCQTSDKVQITDTENLVEERKASKEKEDLEKSKSDKNVSVNKNGKKDNDSNENDLPGTEKAMEIDSEKCKKVNTSIENIKEDQNVTENLGTVSDLSKIIKPPDTLTVVNVKIEIDTKYVDSKNIEKPQKEIQPKTNDGKDKLQSTEVKADSAKDQTNSLQSKLKKAMESLSNVKSVLAAKTDAKLNKIDLKPDSQHNSEKEQSNKSEEKTSESDDQNKHKDSETVCGNLSDLEDHGGESKRKNIFDLIMEDYQSPGKEGKIKEFDGKKNVIEIQESPVKKSPNKAASSAESILEGPENKSADRSLYDVGLTPKPKAKDVDLDVNKEKEKCVALSDELSHDENTHIKSYDNASKTDEPSEISMDISVESKNNDDVSKIDNNSQDVISLDGSSKFENEMEISDDEIDKVQNEMESKHLTMADKILAKFKEWEDEESVPKTHITKIPLKLKISSSPDKSFIVSSSHSSKKKKMTNMRKVDGRLVPMNSTQREIKEPLPMTVLFNPETEIKDKLSAFSSQSLENFIENLTIEVKDDEKVNNEDNDYDDGDEDDDNLIDDDEDEDDDEDDDDDDEDEDENENDSDMSMDEHEPDFDEIDGVLFMSFPSRNALKAHVEVERRTKLGTDENMLLGMTRMRNMRRKQGYILSKYNKKIGNKVLKDKDNISQNLRGMHKTLAKYQRLYKQELQWLDSPNDEGTFMNKTSDVTKIKGWKNKVDNVTDDVENAKAEIENGGKLHWRTEARLAKNLRPDELKEHGLNIKKKRRKNIIYTQRKGMSKGDRSQKSENGQEEMLYDDYSRSNSNDLNDIQFIDEDIETSMTKDGDTESHADIVEERDENIIFPSDDEVQDEELVRIFDRERIKETDKVKNSERQRMIFKSKTLKMRLNYNLQDIQVIRKLGGHNIRRRKNADGGYEGDYTVIMDTSGTNSRPSTPEIPHQEEPEKETPTKKGRKPKLELVASVLTGNMATAACSAIPKQYSRKKPVPKKIIKETDGQSPESGQLTTCDKPGCRYGCICHLCMFTDQSPEADRNVLKCEKEYCRLGCICDSIEAHKEKDTIPHCGKPECMVVCYCDDLAMDETKNTKKDDEDYRFTGQKKTAKYAALPKRQSTYRLAKNLDAVSRKAMLYYESSEMFVDQKKTRRRKSKESTDSPQVYMDVDVPDFEPLQQVSTVPSKSRKQEFLVHRPVPIKPRSSSVTGRRDEMIDFSNIKSEISSQESWNLSDLSEYDDIEVNSDEDQQTTTCARTAVYNAVKREKPQLGITCNCGKLSHKKCSPDDGKFNIPEDILSSGKWHTQWICLRSKGHSLDDTMAEGLRLLEVISNCNYEDFKAKILSRLTSHISHSEYPPLKNFLVGEFKVSILPKSNKPAIIPPEVMAKLPNSVYSIRIQIIKDPYVSNPQIINLIDDTEINIKEVRSGQISKSKLGTIVTPVQNNRAQNAGKKLDRNSELAKHLQSDVNSAMTPITSSCTIVAGGISGLSQLQISRPIGAVSGFSAVPKPVLPDNVSSKNVLPGTIVKAIPVSLSSPGVVGSAGSNVNAIPVSLCGPGMVTPVVLIPNNSVSLGNAVVTAGVTVTQPTTSVASSTLTPTASNVMAIKHQNFPGYVVKGVTSIPNISPGITLSSSLQDQQNLKRKLPDQTDTSDQKKLRTEASLGQSVNTTGSLKQPIPSVSENSDTSIGQVSVLRCIVCNNILTAEDITSWVLSQDSIQEKICVKCKSGQKVAAPVHQKSLPPSQSRSSPIVIDGDNSNSTLAENITQDVEMVDGKELVKTIETEASKIRNIVKEVDESGLQLGLDKNDDELANASQKHSSESKIEENQTKTVIDLSSDEENTTDKSSGKNDESVKKAEKVIENQSDNEEDELEAAIRDAQDDYQDNIVRNLSDDNESQEEEVNKNTSAPKSSVIVIDDEDDVAVTTVEKRKADHSGSEGSSAKRSRDEDEDVDVTSFVEGDSFEMSVPESDSVTSSWHNSSCSLNNAMLRKKRKAQLDLIQNKQLYQAEVKEGFASSDDYRKYKLTKERSRRQEMQSLYKEMADLVMPENEIEDIAIGKTNILDKAIACIKTETSSRSQLIGKVDAFKIYQNKLQKRLVELKAYHVGRGISKDKLESQLDKIAVVCGKIYDHLPEIKKHIKDKKGPDKASTSMPPPVKQKSKKTPKQTKRSKAAASKHKSAEIYIDNPEEYENEEQIGQVATPLSSLPGSYTTSTPVRMQRPAPSLGGPYLPRSNATLTLQPTSIPTVSISSIPASAIKVPNTGGIQTPIPKLSTIAIRFPVQAVRVQSANSVPMPTVSVQGQKPCGIPKNITVQSVNTIVGTPIVESDPLQMGGIVPSIVPSLQGSLIPSTLSNVSDPFIVPQNVPSSLSTLSNPVIVPQIVTKLQNSLSTPISSPLELSSAQDGSINTDIVQNLGQHSSTSGFSAVLGQMITKNIVEEMGSELGMENTQTAVNVQQSDTDKNVKSAAQSIPPYDVNLLKDQILDDSTGELIAVVMNEDDNDSNDSSSRNDENSQNSKSTEETGETSSSVEIISKNEDSCRSSEDRNEERSESSEIEKKISNQTEELETDEAPNIESLLNDIKSLCQEDETPLQQPNLKSSIIKPKNKEDNRILNKEVESGNDLPNNERLDQVDGDIFNFSGAKDIGNLSESDSNNSARTNVYMEDSDGNISIAGEISDGPVDNESNTPKIVSVMSISDVLGDNFKDINEPLEMGPDGDNMTPLFDNV